MEQSTQELMSNLLKAQAAFEQFRQDMKTNRDKVGAIHAFKICYELSWKIMKRILTTQGIESTAPRDIFRKAAAAKLIDNPEEWFGFIEKRHLTSYTYEQENIDAIVASFDSFSAELQALVERIKPLI
jgi:nucleotidyltransferase substrate binding protein (TIGR01987 family)